MKLFNAIAIATVASGALLSVAHKAQAQQSVCQFIINGGPVQEENCRVSFNNNLDDRNDPRYGIGAYFGNNDLYYTIRPGGEASVVMSDETVHHGIWERGIGREAPVIRINGVSFSFY